MLKSFLNQPIYLNKPQNVSLHIGLINGNWKPTKFTRRYTTYRGMMTAYRNYQRANRLIDIVTEIDRSGTFILRGEYR